MIFDINGVEEKIGYVFKDKMLLRKCFTHASYAYEHSTEDNEVLEFFGDTVIQFIVTEHLFKTSTEEEGKLTQMRAGIVSKDPLLKAFHSLGLGEFVLLGEGQQKNKNKNAKLFSSVYEALVAGIYLDGGLAEAKKFVQKTLVDKIKVKSAEEQKCDCLYKGELQEFVQKGKLGSIAYELLSKSGPEHLPVFKVAVTLNGSVIATAEGRNKKQAQTQAAKLALELLTHKN